MMRSRLLVVDLDGTLLGDPAATRRFHRMLTTVRRSTVLAFVTGRSWDETQPVLASPAAPAPDIVGTFTGSLLHSGPDWAMDERWHGLLQPGWRPDRVLAIAAGMPELQVQHASAQHAFRCSFRVLAGDVVRVAAALSEALLRQRIPVRVIVCSGRCLDVVPQQGGKGNLVRYLMERLAIPAERVVVCGNDGNDLDMLDLGVPAVAVGNMAATWRRRLRPSVYQADAAYADGITEGLRHWGWLQPAPAVAVKVAHRHDARAAHAGQGSPFGRLARQFDRRVPG